MEYSIRPMNDADALAISEWHYEDPYSFYDMENDPEDLAELLDPRARGDAYWAVTDKTGELVGFYSCAVQGDTVEMGLGMRPDLTGKGYGLGFLRCGLDFARGEYHPSTITLHVAAFNERAVRVYENAGFKPVQRMMRETNGSLHEFVKMVMPVGY